MSNDPVQTLIDRLRRLGLSNRQIAKAAEVDESTVRRALSVESMNAKTFVALDRAMPALEGLAGQPRDAA